MKNKYEIRGDITAILIDSPKYGRKEALISTSELELVKEFKNAWYVKYENKTKSFYCVGNMTIALNKRRIYGLHQWILGLPKGTEIDHINHDTLDNTNSNIRILSSAHNKQNKRGARRDSKTGIRNVRRNKTQRKFEVTVTIYGICHYFGSFDDIKEAERVAKQARKKLLKYSAENLA